MPAFLFRLVPPRPDFPVTTDDDERSVMVDHVDVWTGFAEQGRTVAFGPVADPAIHARHTGAVPRSSPCPPWSPRAAPSTPPEAAGLVRASGSGDNGGMSDTGQHDRATEPTRDKPWVMRTYSGHSTAKASNELYRTNLAKGQTGLSIAFDLPTQIGYDPDDPAAAGEVGKVGVPVAHLGHMTRAARPDPGRVDEHVDDHQRHRGVAARPVHRQRRGPGRRPPGPVRHDPERHREGVPLAGHLHLPTAARAGSSPWTPSSTPCATSRSGTPSTSAATTCRRRGPRPIQEVAYALATAIGVLDAVRESGQLPDDEFPSWSAVSRSSSTPGSDSSRRPASCGPSPSCGTGCAPSGTACPIPSCGACAMASRSTRSASPRPSPRTTSSASCSSRWASPSPSGPGPRAAAARLERGARTAPAVGPAVVAADPAGPGLRVRPPRVRRHLRRLGGHRGQDRRGGRGRRGPSSRTCWPWAARSRPSTS